MHLGSELDQMPGLGLWIHLFKVGEKLRVSESPESRSIVGHPISDTRNVIGTQVVAKMTLVDAG
jgi:hypothetical protein